MSRTELPESTRALIERLRRTTAADPILDRPRVEAAIGAHLAALGQPARPFTWLDDGRAGYRHVIEIAGDAARAAARAAAWDAARAAAWDAAWAAAWDAARAAAWDAARAAAGDAARDAAWDAARAAAWDAAGDAARAAAGDAARDAAGAAAGAAAWDAARAAAWDAAGAAAWAAAGDAAWAAAIARARAIWLPFVDAYEAGLWLFWITPREVIAVPRPALRVVERRLHCATGPAVFWPNGTAYWFWRGVQVSRAWIETPERLDPKMALAEKNAEKRRCLYEILGYERILGAVSAKRIALDDFGELIEAQLGDDRGKPARFVRVKCPSTGRIYVNRVRPEVATAREAVASRWRLKPEEYVLGAES